MRAGSEAVSWIFSGNCNDAMVGWRWAKAGSRGWAKIGPKGTTEIGLRRGLRLGPDGP